MDIKKYFLTTTFKDSRDRLVYYDHFTKQAYRIPKEVESMFKTFQGKGLYTVAIFFLLYSNDGSIFKAIALSLLFFIGANAYFYLKMIPGYKTVHNFDLESEQKTIKVRGSAARFLLIGLYVISIGLIIYLAITEKDQVIIAIAILYSLFATFKIIQSLLLMNKD